ncbi:MAG: response regulator transcription factor [Desulfovibrionaceae bacterium]|nr:response regulator transcription factor [Desulfovibrionaceae bacterium]
MQDICRILLVDDHKLLMEGVRSLLAPYPHLRVAGMAQSGSEAVPLAASLMPHIIIMDLGMPGMNGVEASRAVLQVLPEARILIYTGHEDQRFLPELVELGIMGHVRKSESPGVLLEAIDSIRAGEVFLTCPDPGGCLSAMLRARLEAREAHGPDISVLSPREKEIFRLLADGQSVKNIAQHLFISPKTVESHKYNVLTKLKAGSMGDLVKIAIRHGLLQL